MDGLSLHPKISRRAKVQRWLRSRLPSIVGDGASTLGSKVVSQVVQLLVFLVAARMLESAEFGLYAYSSAIVVMLVVIAEGGWGEFVMKRDCTDRELDQIGTISIIAGVLVTIAGLSAAALAWFLLPQADEAFLLVLFSCWFLPSSLYVVYDGLLVARGLLRKQAAIRIASEVVGLCVTMLGLWTGWSVFSLAAGRLAAQLVCLGGSIIVLKWYPKLYLTWPFTREILEFSGHILSNRLILFLRSYSGTLAIGSFLGLAEAGYYRVAERIIAAFSELIGEPARMLAWTLFRRSAITPDSNGTPKRDVGASATAFMTVLMAISAPIYLGLSLISSNLIDIVLGDKWAPAAILVTILSMKQVLLTPGYVTEALLSLSGNIRRMPPTLLLNAAVSVGLILLLAPFGVEAAAWGQCIASLISFLTSMHLQQHYGGLGWGRVIRKSGYVIVAILLMAATVYGLGYYAEVWNMRRVLTVVLQVLMGGAIYVLVLTALQKLMGSTASVCRPANRNEEITMATLSLSGNTRSILKGAVQRAAHALSPLRAAAGRLHYLSPLPRRFTGAYGTFEAAMAAARRQPMAGYDHEEIASVSFAKMCQVAPWDYPVLFWMRSLMPTVDGLIDAGGHMGTKYRAFRPLLSLDGSFRWIVYDLAAIVRAGRSLAERDGLTGLSFVDRVEDAGAMPLFLGSGLMQYLDMPLSDLLKRLPSLPTHLILNKVALRKGGAVVTLERIGKTHVPYHMRDEASFIDDVTGLGYRQVDRWSIPSLSHVIDTHPELGRSESAGFYFRLD